MTTPAGSGVTNKGTTYANGSQITSTNLNDIVDDAVFNTNAVDDSTIGLNSSTPKALFVKNAGIDTAQIKDNAVTTVKITDANVTTAKIADSNVTTEKIADDAVTGAKISDTAALPDGVTATTQSANDNSEKVATTAYADNAAESTGVKVATFNIADGSTASDITIQITEQADPDNIATVSSGVVTIGNGLYLIRFFGYYELGQGTFDIDYKINGSIVADNTISGGNDPRFSFIFDYIHSVTDGADTVQIDLDETQEFSSVSFENVGVTIMKLG